MKIKEKDLDFTDWKGGTSTLEDGDGLYIPSEGVEFNFVCCDCSLTHKIIADFTDKGGVRLQFFRADRKTAAFRRGKRPQLKEGIGKWMMVRQSTICL